MSGSSGSTVRRQSPPKRTEEAQVASAREAQVVPEAEAGPEGEARPEEGRPAESDDEKRLVGTQKTQSWQATKVVVPDHGVDSPEVLPAPVTRPITRREVRRPDVPREHVPDKSLIRTASVEAAGLDSVGGPPSGLGLLDGLFRTVHSALPEAELAPASSPDPVESPLLRKDLGQGTLLDGILRTVHSALPEAEPAPAASQADVPSGDKRTSNSSLLEDSAEASAAMHSSSTAGSFAHNPVNWLAAILASCLGSAMYFCEKTCGCKFREKQHKHHKHKDGHAKTKKSFFKWPWGSSKKPKAGALAARRSGEPQKAYHSARDEGVPVERSHHEHHKHHEHHNERPHHEHKHHERPHL